MNKMYEHGPILLFGSCKIAKVALKLLCFRLKYVYYNVIVTFTLQYLVSVLHSKTTTSDHKCTESFSLTVLANLNWQFCIFSYRLLISTPHAPVINTASSKLRSRFVYYLGNFRRCSCYFPYANIQYHFRVNSLMNYLI